MQQITNEQREFSQMIENSLYSLSWDDGVENDDYLNSDNTAYQKAKSFCPNIS